MLLPPERGRTDHEAFKGHILVDIFIAPVPLVARRLDRDVANRDGLFLEQDGQREGPDHHQDNDGNQCPRHFQRRIVRESRRRRVGPAVVADHDIDQQRGNEDDNRADDVKDEPVQPLLVMGDVGRRRLKPDTTLNGLPNDLKRLLCKR
jgi:hypothetical protein